MKMRTACLLWTLQGLGRSKRQVGSGCLKETMRTNTSIWHECSKWNCIARNCPHRPHFVPSSAMSEHVPYEYYSVLPSVFCPFFGPNISNGRARWPRRAGHRERPALFYDGVQTLTHACSPPGCDDNRPLSHQGELPSGGVATRRSLIKIKDWLMQRKRARSQLTELGSPHFRPPSLSRRWWESLRGPRREPPQEGHNALRGGRRGPFKGTESYLGIWTPLLPPQPFWLATQCCCAGFSSLKCPSHKMLSVKRYTL